MDREEFKEREIRTIQIFVLTIVCLLFFLCLLLILFACVSNFGLESWKTGISFAFTFVFGFITFVLGIISTFLYTERKKMKETDENAVI